MPIKPLTAWSFSRLRTYLECPFKAFLKYIQRLPDPPGPPLVEGSRIHKLAEDFLKGLTKKLAPELVLFKDLFKALVKIRSRLQIEAELAFDAKWLPVDWFSPYVYIRIKMDVMYDDPKDTSIRRIIDWKTGRRKPVDEEQLEVYAIGAFLTAPANIKRVDCTLAYTKTGEVVEKTFMRSDLPKLQKKWSKKALPMLRDRLFKPTPSDESCKFCLWSKKKGGPCKF